MGDIFYICRVKTLLVRVVCLVLALSVFSGSVGMAATQHICLQTGLKMKAPVKSTGNSCCKKVKKATVPQKLVFQKKCCALSVSHYKLEPESNASFFSIKVPAILPFPVISFIPQWSSVSITQKLIVSGLNKAPPRAGRTLLIFLRILTI